jgi:D-arginine dehydrogenase
MVSRAAQIADVAVIGGGMVGATIGFNLALLGKDVVVLEAENQIGFHSTGRSAAVFSETYGGSVVRALSQASRQFFFEPPAGFVAHPLVTPRGELHVADSSTICRLDALAMEPDVAAVTRRLTAPETLALCPILKRDFVASGLFEPDASDIDVDGLHQGYVRALRAMGGRLVLDAQIESLRRSGDLWDVETPKGRWQAEVVVNAAGAWAGQIAELAGARRLGLQPCRRTAMLIEAPSEVTIRQWPFVIDAAETFYFKPDAGAILLSPADETPSDPCDASADEFDIAVAIDRFERATTMTVRRVRNRWAGLRTFVSDRAPLLGFDDQVPGFFWAAALGGYGIQTAPAVGELGAQLLVSGRFPEKFSNLSLTAEALAPGREGASPAKAVLRWAPSVNCETG